jgi:hypothetical protein
MDRSIDFVTLVTAHRKSISCSLGDSITSFCTMRSSCRGRMTTTHGGVCGWMMDG